MYQRLFRGRHRHVNGPFEEWHGIGRVQRAFLSVSPRAILTVSSHVCGSPQETLFETLLAYLDLLRGVSPRKRRERLALKWVPGYGLNSADVS